MHEIAVISETTKPAWRNACRRAAKAQAKVDRRVAAALAKGKPYLARAIMRCSLGGRASITAAALTVNAKMPPAQRLKQREAISLAASLSPWRGTEEPVDVRAKRKAGGGERPYLAYGWESRVLQEQVGHAIKPFLAFDDRCFLQRGADRAIEKAISLIRHMDWRWVIEADISNFYPSIDKEEIAGLLPIDERIAHVVITSDHANRRYTYPKFMRGHSTAVHAITAFRGLPQGARTSPAVADALVASRLAKLPDGFAVVNFGDNFLIGGRTRREALQNFETLVAAFGRCSGPQFTVVQKQLRRRDQGFKFLGYKISIRHNRIVVEPQENQIRRALLQFDHILSRADGPDGPMRVWRVVSSRIGSLSLWRGADNWCFRWLSILAADDPKRQYMAQLSLDRLKCRIRLSFGLEA